MLSSQPPTPAPWAGSSLRLNRNFSFCATALGRRHYTVTRRLTRDTSWRARWQKAGTGYTVTETLNQDLVGTFQDTSYQEVNILFFVVSFNVFWRKRHFLLRMHKQQSLRKVK